MGSLPYRATVFLRPLGLQCGQMQMMERSFAEEADAVCWCRVMTEASTHATGAWMIARNRGGRMLELTQEHGLRVDLAPPADSAPSDAVDLRAVLAGPVVASEADVGASPVGLDLVAPA